MKIHSSSDDTTNFRAETPVFVNSCGKQTHSDKVFSVLRDSGREDFHILLMKCGSCRIEINGKKTILAENDFAVYFPHQRQHYIFPETKSVSYWMHFSGSDVPEIMEKCNLTSGIHHVHSIGEIGACFEKLIGLYSISGFPRGNSPVVSLESSAVLTQLLCLLSNDIYGSSGRSIIDEFISYVNDNFTQCLDVDAFCRNVQLSRHRFSELFRTKTGLTVHRYITNVRINEAKHLLRCSTLNISEISDRIGFADALYFSRVFKKITGSAPSDFRRLT